MGKLFLVEIGGAIMLVKAKGPKAALRAGLATEVVRVRKADPDELYSLGASGVKYIDTTAIVADDMENDDE